MEKFTAANAQVICTAPAAEWAEGYPLGNGRIGAVVWGEGGAEILSLNHELLWRRYFTHPLCHTHKDMPEIRSLCRQGKWQEAEALLLRTVPNTGEAIYINPFVPMADLYITMYRNASAVSDYRRVLDLEHGISTTAYRLDGVTYYSTSFCDSVGGLLYTHLYADRPGKLTGAVSLSRMPDGECTVGGGADCDGVFCEGLFEEGVHFALYSAVYHRGGRLTGGKKHYGLDGEALPPKKFGHGFTFDRNEGVSAERGASICMDTCDEVWIVTALSTDVLDDDPLGAAKDAARRNGADFLAFEERQEQHRSAFSDMFSRTRLYLPDQTQLQGMFDMARYVAISSGMTAPSSNEISAPINLQGIWNRDTRPAWESDYHLDLNIQMCYWPLPSMGLADCMEPYLCWMERLLPQARVCAADLYGADGACYTGCCDPYTIGAVDNVGFGALGISAWLADILYLYYEYMPSSDLLARIRVLMAEIDAFYRSVFEEVDGHLTLPFGSSPEMSLMIGEHRQWLSSPSAFDLTAIRAFYTEYQTLSRLTGDTETASACGLILDRLIWPTLDADGALQEWTDAHTEGEPGHRHRSPFVAFCPGTLFTCESHPDTVRAMEALLMRRLSYGNGMSTAFSYAWDAQILARLGRGDDAFAMLDKLHAIHALDSGMLTTNDHDGKNGGISWFTGIKVIQVEAQLASAAAITELFCRDEQALIRVLPALPAAIPNGALYGLRGRRGLVYDIEWESGRLKEFCMHVSCPGVFRILLPDTAFCVTDDAGKDCIADYDGMIMVLDAKTTGTYRFVRK